MGWAIDSCAVGWSDFWEKINRLLGKSCQIVLGPNSKISHCCFSIGVETRESENLDCYPEMGTNKCFNMFLSLRQGRISSLGFFKSWKWLQITTTTKKKKTKVAHFNFKFSFLQIFSFLLFFEVKDKKIAKFLEKNIDF